MEDAPLCYSLLHLLVVGLSTFSHVLVKQVGVVKVYVSYVYHSLKLSLKIFSAGMSLNQVDVDGTLSSGLRKCSSMFGPVAATTAYPTTRLYLSSSELTLHLKLSLSPGELGLCLALPH